MSDFTRGRVQKVFFLCLKSSQKRDESWFHSDLYWFPTEKSGNVLYLIIEILVGSHDVYRKTETLSESWKTLCSGLEFTCPTVVNPDLILSCRGSSSCPI